MKTNKPDAELVWKQLEDVLAPRLGLNLTERVVYAHLLRHSRLEGKRQLRFSIVQLARSVRLSDQPARHAVRSLAAKGALRLVDRTQAGHLAEVFLPEEIHAAPHAGAACAFIVCGGSSPVGESSTTSSRRPAVGTVPTAISFPAASNATRRREQAPPKIFCAPSIACAA